VICPNNEILFSAKKKLTILGWDKVVKHLPSKCETLTSNPSTIKKKKKALKSRENMEES
jgi:hypothetical protein